MTVYLEIKHCMHKQITMLERILAFYSLLRYYAQLVSRIFIIISAII